MATFNRESNSFSKRYTYYNMNRYIYVYILMPGYIFITGVETKMISAMQNLLCIVDIYLYIIRITCTLYIYILAVLN